VILYAESGRIVFPAAKRKVLLLGRSAGDPGMICVFKCIILCSIQLIHQDISEGSLALPVTVVTVAFGNRQVVQTWTEQWSRAGANCIITNNGSAVPAGVTGDAIVLQSPVNSGFGAGINLAVQRAETPVVLITNPDTLPVAPDALKTLTDFHTRGSLSGSRTVNSAGREVYSTGTWPTVKWVRSQVFRPAGTLWRKDSIDWLQGSLIMVHRDDFLQLGGFARNYPLYFEDVDLCFRARKQGMKVDFCEESSFIHNEGSGSEKAVSSRLSCFHWGMLEFFKSNDSVNAALVRRIIIAKCILRLFVYAPTDREAFKGYYRALQSVYSSTAPVLPGRGQ